MKWIPDSSSSPRTSTETTEICSYNSTAWRTYRVRSESTNNSMASVSIFRQGRQEEKRWGLVLLLSSVVFTSNSETLRSPRGLLEPRILRLGFMFSGTFFSKYIENWRKQCMIRTSYVSWPCATYIKKVDYGYNSQGKIIHCSKQNTSSVKGNSRAHELHSVVLFPISPSQFRDLWLLTRESTYEL